MTYDAIIIGSGQAGNPLWDSLTERGWTVALIEQAHLGGTCINTGCTPTKTMVASAQVAYYARQAPGWGVQTDRVQVDLACIVARKPPWWDTPAVQGALRAQARPGRTRRHAERD